MTSAPDYYKPKDLSEALQLLQQPTRRVLPLAGGSWLVPRLRRDIPSPLSDNVDAVVDLAGLGLRYIELKTDDSQQWLCLGATITLAAVAESHLCRNLASGILAKAAHAEMPVNVRNVATVGGCIASSGAASDGVASQFVLALLALAAHVVVDDGQQRVLSLLEVLADPVQAIGRGLIVELRLPWAFEGANSGLAQVARTPSDQPIVAAAAVSDGRNVRVAVGGVAGTPVLLRLGNPTELDSALASALPELDTPDDFRGSAQYRLAMAAVVVRRALAQATT